MTGIDLDVTIPERDLRVAFDVPAGSVTALVGPNGAGKSSVLQAIAGLLRPAEGSVRVGGNEVTSGSRVVPPHRRKVALLTQRPLLFPHLDVLDNVAFGPRAAGMTTTVAREVARHELDAVGCGGFAARRPGTLSGGEAQRVAIARALASRPEAILLDEPLASLDVEVAPEVRHWLRLRLSGRTAVLVTHDVVDLWTLADRIVVLDSGRVVEAGPTESLLARPASAFLARVCGRNLLAGVAVDPATLRIGDDLLIQGRADPEQPPVAGGRALASIPPAAIALYAAPPSGSPRNVMRGTVTGVESRGDIALVGLDIGGVAIQAEVTAAAVADLAVRPGIALHAAVKATQVRLYGR